MTGLQRWIYTVVYLRATVEASLMVVSRTQTMSMTRYSLWQPGNQHCKLQKILLKRMWAMY